MAFLVATYNILAASYIRPEWYPGTPPELLASERRLPRLVDHIAALGADVLCLQEVEADAFAAIDARLSRDGFVGRFAQKREGRPDGCATFAREAAARWIREEVVVYDDAPPGGRRSGHIAQVVVLEVEGRALGVANTHLRWDPPDVPGDRRLDARQLGQLLAVRSRIAPECEGWIVCGDFNATPDGAAIEVITGHGLSFAHAASPAPTNNANRRASMIDYLFHDAPLATEPLPIAPVADDTPLPGEEQPSDHVAVAARFAWRARGDG